MKKTLRKFDNAIAVGGLSVASVFCLILAGSLFFEPVYASSPEISFWGTIVFQVVLIGCSVLCAYLVVKYFEKKREARLREEEERTGLKLL